MHRRIKMPEDRKQYMKIYQLKWIKERRLQYLNGKKCFFCDSDQNIEIHHKDPSNKESNSIWSWAHPRIVLELEKCVFVCCECHKKIHSIIHKRPLIHGTYYAYRRYRCRCELCRAANAKAKISNSYEANKEWA